MGETADYGPEDVSEAFSAYERLKQASWVDYFFFCFLVKRLGSWDLPIQIPKFGLFQVGLSLVHDHSGRCFKRAASKKVTLKDVEANKEARVFKHMF